ncbi:LysM peptidoglycan-binding domain-containing protein [Actinotalea sp. JY-7876]|uniref:LysM peptidoglycan-binding domain-containing protein n=1 Tax=Actinotalea sp. JY-7876 TaxID=2758442 RepID=UPI0015F44FAB|nr:LysM peptidoglycan-binding domain-containing protein [Actinotalea sp. JY-7876]
MTSRWRFGAGLVRSGAACAAAAGGAALLATLAVDRAAQTNLATPGGVEAGVLVVVLAGGALAAAVLALGCGLLVVSLASQALGRRAATVERLGSRLTPAILRRVLAVGVGGVLVATPAAAATGGPSDPGTDLGWTVTTSVAEPAPAPGSSPIASAPTGAAPVPAAAAPLTAAALVPAAPEPSAVAAPVHVVAPGDTLWAIARDHLPAGSSAADVAAAWPAWHAANTDVVGTDPDLIHPGQHLRAPAGPTTTHEEQP